MELDFNITIRNGRLTVIKNELDSGTGQAKILFYDSTKPDVGDDITTQTLLATGLFEEPCGSVDSATLTLFIDGDISVSESGVITWARILTADDDFVADADVTDNNGTGAIKVDNTQVYTGGTLRVISAVIYEP